MARRVLIPFVLLIVLLATFFGASAGPLEPLGEPPPIEAEFAPGELLVRFRPGVGLERVEQILQGRGAARLRAVRRLGVHVLRVPPGLSVERAVEVFRNIPEVEFAEPNYILHAVAPMRTEVIDQWGLNKIEAPAAWSEFGGSPPEIIIATIDTGVAKDHVDLSERMWWNASEVSGETGVDDDANGYVDDTWGWDFVNNDNEPLDDNMHGTYVSSIAAATKGNGGVAGVCPWCKIMAVKVLSAIGSGNIATVANGIIYAADNGAQVINLSLAGIIGSQALQNAVDYAWGKGVLVVAAAGNDGIQRIVFPAGYANTMAVASSNKEDYRSCFSNYSQDYISVAAPGEAIEGAVPSGGYETHSGTSAAAPHVAGLGGLLFSQDGSRTNADVRDLIQKSANDLGPTGTDAFFGSGRINAYRAVTGVITPTDPPTGMFADDITASGYAHARKLARDSSGKLHLVWHGHEGDQYQVFYATSTDNGLSWSSPEVVFSSEAETFHPALALDETHIYLAFPSKYLGPNFGVFFTSKPLSGSGWSTPDRVLGGSYHAVRPDLFYDPSNGYLHLVASSFDDAPYVYHRTSDNGGGTWGDLHQIQVNSTSGEKSRYADVHANGPNVYIAGRTVKLTLWGLLPEFRLFSIRSENWGEDWTGLTEHAFHKGLLSSEYGASLAGDADQLILAYEHAGVVYIRTSEGGVTWSGAGNMGGGTWPSITLGQDGQAWLMWESGGNLNLRHYTGSSWEDADNLGAGNYPNLKLGTSGNQVEWANTHCSGAPFRLMYGSLSLGPIDNPPSVSIIEPAEGSTVSGPIMIQIEAMDAEDPTGALTVEWNGDGGAWQTAAYNSGTGYYEASWDTTSETEGPHVLNARATDSAANTGYDSKSVTVDNVNELPVATFTYSCGGLTCSFDASGSDDPDGTVVDYGWDFGDGESGSGVTTEYTYTEAGSYTVVLTVTDDDGGMDADSQEVTVSDAATTMHVEDLSGSSEFAGRWRWFATVVVLIHDETGAPVADALVTGNWNGAYTGIYSCTTDATGTCTVTSRKQSRLTPNVTYAVEDVSHAVLAYQPSDNLETSITINRP